MPASHTTRALLSQRTVETPTCSVYIAYNLLKDLMLHRLFILCLLIMLQGIATLHAQFISDNHVVTVTVLPITLIQLTGAAVTLDITDANSVAGQDLMTVTNNATRILWGTNSSLQKITVVTDQTAALYTLQVEAKVPTQGTALGPVTLSPTAADLLLNIGRSSGSCTLSYTASVLASQGTGTESHLITLTIQAQ